MKKIITLIIALILALSLSACDFSIGGNSGISNPPSESTNSPGENTSTPDPGQSATEPGATEPSKPTDPSKPNESVDAKLIGLWEYRDAYTSDYSYYTFNEDGTFKYNHTKNNREYTGKYSASDGKVYLMDITYSYAAFPAEKRVDVVVEYEFGTNIDGEFLRVYELQRAGNEETYLKVTEGTTKFRKK